MEEIVNTVREDIQTLSNKDVVIIWGGSNDISKNNTKVAINQLCKFVEEKKNVNLVILKAPQRHDLMPSSCVNSEVLRFNRQIEKRMKTYRNVKVLDTALDRKYFTTHGQHLNSSGKELISNKLSMVIKEMFVKKQSTPIRMPWKEISQLTELNHNNPDQLPPNTKTTKQPQISDVGVPNTEFPDQKNLKELPTPLNLSKRQRKQVALRNTEFLWT